MIFKNELKRFLHPVILVFLIIMSVLWYLIYMTNCNVYLDINAGMPYQIGKEYVQRFGTTIDNHEIEEIKKDYEVSKSELNVLIKQSMGKYGIETIDEYQDYFDKYYDIFTNQKSDDYNQAIDKWGEEEYNRRAKIYDKIEEIYWKRNSPINNAAFKTQSIQAYIDEYNYLLDIKKAYKTNDDTYFFGNITKQERQVLENRLNKDEIAVGVGYIPLEENFVSYSRSWSLLIFICCAILIIPMLIKNKLNNVVALQYSTKQGKRILFNQLFAALSAGLLISIILIFVFQLFYFKGDIIDFINCPINLDTISDLYWFDFTLLDYMICLWLKTILLTISEILVLFWISYYGKNYVIAIAASVPIIILFHFISKSSNKFLHIFLGYPRFLYPQVIIVTIIITVMLSIIFLHKIKKADYLD